MKSWAVLVIAACGSSGKTPQDARVADAVVDTSVDAGPGAGPCDPLAQTGCNPGAKCTWIIDDPMTGAAHTGCAFGGTAAIGEPCAVGVNGIDNCGAGSVCVTDLGPGTTCHQICDLGDVAPLCDATHACVAWSVFTSGGSTLAGVCRTRCNPLDDNDFDGSGSALARAGSSCGSDLAVGCYGLPSEGTHPATTFTCYPDLGQGFHRDAVPPTSVNICHQGYMPLFYESTGSTTIICSALCKPQNCYAGNCGSADENRLGAAPHRCETPDAVGTFDTGSNGDQCMYLWYLERDRDHGNQLLPSPYSDSVGVCWNHSRYQYDPSGGNNPTITYPACEQLQLHATGTDPTNPLTYFGAADLGCVDSHTAGLTFTGKPVQPAGIPRLGSWPRER